MLKFMLIGAFNLCLGWCLGQSPRLLIQCDDAGFSHGSNVALARLAKSGLKFNASVMFAGPWYQETVSILKDHPDICVGVHLCATSEWDHYKWGPVAGRSRVPSLVDEEGHFPPSTAALYAQQPKLEELELEFQAQIDRAKRSGLRIDYVDVHMGVATATADQRKMLQALVQRNGLRYAWAQDVKILDGFWDRYEVGALDQQLTRLLTHIENMESDTPYVAIFHIGTDTPELQAMYDGRDGWPVMATQRQLELDMLLSEQFKRALRDHEIELIQYRDLP